MGFSASNPNIIFTGVIEVLLSLDMFIVFISIGRPKTSKISVNFCSHKEF